MDPMGSHFTLVHIPAPRPLLQGYATFDYEDGEYRSADLVRLDILAQGSPVDALCRLVPRDAAASIGRAILATMAGGMERQQFQVVLQVSGCGREAWEVRRRGAACR
eukprot:353350-Chlamydomonas_euryale.AAC.19